MEVARIETMAGYVFGFLLEQSLGHVTHAKNLLTNVARGPEVQAHWGPANASRLLGLLKAEANEARAKKVATSTERYSYRRDAHPCACTCG
jgi:hypothetical protein